MFILFTDQNYTSCCYVPPIHHMVFHINNQALQRRGLHQMMKFPFYFPIKMSNHANRFLTLYGLN